MNRTVFTDIAEFESRLGLPSGFYDRLLREDDWSFVIKLNALFEGACTHVLAARLHAPELADALAHLDFANSKCGKVVMLRSLEAITSEQAAILRSLAELRNRLVHNVSNVAFTFGSYVASLDSNQLKALIKNYGHVLKDTIEIEDLKIPRNQFVRENAKLSLWLTAAELLACLHLEYDVVHVRLQKLAMNEYYKLATVQSLTSAHMPPTATTNET